ncbi:3-hydroxybutyryl-CoA dehydrogenase [Rhodobacteraceae bacterium B1Z28]|uniref:3-hydroxybutyryl-CoA dehydrogenase n=1 Tax=Ruegeria haliotis TaxID=2747601 RepID=A0ABX2PVP5_9RHOB|nr:3-hydroxybutyryl-CoA dehydrogenase [Ruegeria haliotis]NVO57426.1 3-hydroxybutyryl-CoA dehydrogenase [Ruegeria haliotis]
MNIRSVGIIGAGQMGAGIAQVFAASGYDVLMNDISGDALTQARTRIETGTARMVQKEKMSDADRDRTLSKLDSTTDLAALGPCDLIIEAATENEETKQKIFKGLEPSLAEHSLLASNTSSISITRMASQTDRPECFMGLHFMNPVPVMKLVELIRGIATSAETFETMKTVVASLGKISANAEDYPAFIVNRVLIPMINEACYTLYEGVGNVASIDAALKLGANHPMGPLELGDFIGLDTCLSIMNVMHHGLADSKYRPCPLLVKYVEAGWLGRKSGRGFYDYRGETPIPTR